MGGLVGRSVGRDTAGLRASVSPLIEWGGHQGFGGCRDTAGADCILLGGAAGNAPQSGPPCPSHPVCQAKPSHAARQSRAPVPAPQTRGTP